jgi:hypothetical protein
VPIRRAWLGVGFIQERGNTYDVEFAQNTAAALFTCVTQSRGKISLQGQRLSAILNLGHTAEDWARGWPAVGPKGSDEGYLSDEA